MVPEQPDEAPSVYWPIDATDESDLDAKVARIESQVDALSTAEREIAVQQFRSAVVDSGVELTPEDEQVLTMFVEGTLDARHLIDHFGPRIVSKGDKAD